MIAEAIVRLFREFKRRNVAVRFHRRTDGLLAIIFNDASSAILDLHEAKIVKHDMGTDAFNETQSTFRNAGFEFPEPESEPDFGPGM